MCELKKRKEKERTKEKEKRRISTTISNNNIYIYSITLSNSNSSFSVDNSLTSVPAYVLLNKLWYFHLWILWITLWRTLETLMNCVI